MKVYVNTKTGMVHASSFCAHHGWTRNVNVIEKDVKDVHVPEFIYYCKRCYPTYERIIRERED